MGSSVHKAAVIGDGAMGTVCALLLAEKGLEVALWGAAKGHVATLQRERVNQRYLPGYPFPEHLTVMAHDGTVFNGVELIVSAVPCQFMRSVWTRLRDVAPRDVPIVSVAKGLEVTTLLRPTQILIDCLGAVPVACLSGPTIGPEVAARKPASVVVASHDSEVALRVQQTFATPYLRVYTSDDLLGVEIAGAVKNVIALAAGICDGMGAGDNAKASLVTRGLVEITRLGVALGARAETFRGLAGVGDLVTTCISRIGRNRSAGERIGRGELVEHVLATTPSVIEGIPTTRSVMALARQHGVEMPIVAAIASVLFDGTRPAEAIEKLMTRQLRSE